MPIREKEKSFQRLGTTMYPRPHRVCPCQQNGRSPHWLKSKNPACAAVKREAEEDWGGDMRAQPLFLKGPKLSQIKRDHA
jgi:hypothetical protein